MGHLAAEHCDCKAEVHLRADSGHATVDGNNVVHRFDDEAVCRRQTLVGRLNAELGIRVTARTCGALVEMIEPIKAKRIGGSRRRSALWCRPGNGQRGVGHRWPYLAVDFLRGLHQQILAKPLGLIEVPVVGQAVD